LIHLYSLVWKLFHILEPIWQKNNRYSQFRSRQTKTWQSFLTTPLPKGSKRYWLHGASVGELDQVRGLSREIQKQEPESVILVSTFSESVTARQLQSEDWDFGIYLPWENKKEYQMILEHLEPKIFVVFAWDIWPILLSLLKKKGTKLYFGAAGFSKTSSRLKFPLKSLTTFSLGLFDNIYPAHNSFVDTFEKLLPNREFEVVGDTRIDTVLDKIEIKKEPLERLLSDLESPIVFGSTYVSCEIGIELWREKYPKENIWVFPHKYEKERSKSWQNYIHWSEILDGSKKPSQSIVFDILGNLAFAYRYAKAAYIGGAFHNRVHNTLEPAAFGLPIFTGPKIANASEAMNMNKLGGLIILSSPLSMVEIMEPDWIASNGKELGKKNLEFVLESKGASRRLFEKIKN